MSLDVPPDDLQLQLAVLIQQHHIDNAFFNEIVEAVN